MNDPTNAPQPRILIVEDSGRDRILLRTLLEKAGYREVQAVGSAREALHLLGMPQPGSPARVTSSFGVATAAARDRAGAAHPGGAAGVGTGSGRGTESGQGRMVGAEGAPITK